MRGRYWPHGLWYLRPRAKQTPHPDWEVDADRLSPVVGFSIKLVNHAPKSGLAWSCRRTCTFDTPA